VADAITKHQPETLTRINILTTHDLSSKAAQLKSFMAMDVLERAQELERSGRDIIHLAVGEPDFATPEAIKEAGIQALQQDHTHYTHSLGLYELRLAIVEDYRKRYGITISPEQILVTSGTSPALLLACAACLNPGDRVILSDPGYACYANFIRFCDGAPSRFESMRTTAFSSSLPSSRKNWTPIPGPY
jgi:aspartate/methionine/tyrosine aminotransferase